MEIIVVGDNSFCLPDRRSHKRQGQGFIKVYLLTSSPERTSDAKMELCRQRKPFADVMRDANKLLFTLGVSRKFSLREK